MNTCSQPGCSGTIADGYCDVCGMAPSPTAPVAGTSGATGATGSTAASARRSTVTNRLGMVPLGSARSASGSRPTRRLGASRSSSRLGAGLTHVAAVPIRDPLQALMDPPAVAEDKRFCSVCQSPVGRSRDGAPGRAKGFCPKCRTPFDFEPKLRAGTLLGGQYEIVGCLAHGGMGWIYLARDRNVNDRWVVVKGLLNAGDPDAFRAAVAEKQFLAEVEHPTIVEIYNFVSGPDGASYIIMEYVGGQALNSLLKSRMQLGAGASKIAGHPGKCLGYRHRGIETAAQFGDAADVHPQVGGESLDDHDVGLSRSAVGCGRGLAGLDRALCGVDPVKDPRQQRRRR